MSRGLGDVYKRQALDPAFRAGHPVRRVSGYGRRTASGAADSAFDRDMVEELRSLGYIQ